MNRTDNRKENAAAQNTFAFTLCKDSKEEIAGKPLFSRKDKLAFMSALLFSSGSLLIHDGRVAVTVSTQNRTILQAVQATAESLTGRACTVHMRGKTSELVLDNALSFLIACRVLDGEGGRVNEHIAPEFVEDQSAAAAYVRGAYLGSGNLNARKYHLEFSFGKKTIADDFAQLLARSGIAAKVAVRAARAVVYCKSGAGICDCLALMGAAKAVLRLNSILVDRQMAEHLNRQQNCDLYNIDKQIDTGLRQCAHIRSLPLDTLTPALKDTAAARLQHPDYSYEQLAAALGISKSGLKNRLRRLEQMHATEREEGKMVFKETTVGRQFVNTDAQKLVMSGMRFDSEITLEMGTKKINAKSLMGVISLALRAGDAVTVIAKGDDQEAALDAVIKLLHASAL